MHYLTWPLVIGASMAFARALSASARVSNTAVALLIFGFVVSTSSARSWKGFWGDIPGPIYWPGYVAFLIATAFALFLRAATYSARLETVATVGVVVLLSSAAMILLRLAVIRADARKDT